MHHGICLDHVIPGFSSNQSVKLIRTTVLVIVPHLHCSQESDRYRHGIPFQNIVKHIKKYNF